MHRKILLSLLNNDGTIASLEDGDSDVTIVVSNTSRNGKKICLEAAKRLRMFADRFEMLAEFDNPYLCENQDIVNKGSK
jgi:hypothetical protein